MTPQTLDNDLKTDNCDPSDIILLVIGASATLAPSSWSVTDSFV
jgi:hypothetical protein